MANDGPPAGPRVERGDPVPGPSHPAVLPAPAFVVLAVDPQTGEVDTYGPFDRPGALADAQRRRRELDDGDLEDVLVGIVRLHPPRTGGDGAGSHRRP